MAIIYGPQGAIPEPFASWPTLAPFTRRMAAELQANSHKGHWAGADEATMIAEVVYHVGKLHDALIYSKGDPLEFAADVANLCMMIVDNRGLLSSSESEKR